MNALPRYRSLKSLANDLKKESKDNFIFNGLWFTMDYYDEDGKTMTYGNKSESLVIECSTENRYKSRKDMVCTIDKMNYINHNINYIN